MECKFVIEYAKRMGISPEEAMQHAIVKEYLKDHEGKPEPEALTETRIAAGCGSAVAHTLSITSCRRDGVNW